MCPASGWAWAGAQRAAVGAGNAAWRTHPGGVTGLESPCACGRSARARRHPRLLLRGPRRVQRLVRDARGVERRRALPRARSRPPDGAATTRSSVLCGANVELRAATTRSSVLCGAKVELRAATTRSSVLCGANVELRAATRGSGAALPRCPPDRARRAPAPATPAAGRGAPARSPLLRSEDGPASQRRSAFSRGHQR